MSIEKDLTRIADALEALVGKLDHIGQAVDVPAAPPAIANPAYSGSIGAVDETPKQPPVTPPSPEAVAGGASTPVTTAPVAAVPPSPPAAQVTPAPTTQQPVSTPAVMTPEELNAALVIEFQRLGSREPIDQVMRAAPFNAQSITDLSADQYSPLIAAVKAVSA